MWQLAIAWTAILFGLCRRHPYTVQLCKWRYGMHRAAGVWVMHCSRIAEAEAVVSVNEQNG